MQMCPQGSPIADFFEGELHEEIPSVLQFKRTRFIVFRLSRAACASASEPTFITEQHPKWAGLKPSRGQAPSLGLNRLRLISYPEGQKRPPGNPSGFEKNRETQVTMPTWHIGHLGWASGFVHTQVGIARKKLLQRDPSFHQSELAT